MRIGIDIDDVISSFSNAMLKEYLKHDKTLRNTGKAQYYMVELKDGILFYKDHIADVEPRDIVDVLDIETEIEDKVDLFDEYQLIFIIFVTVLCVSIIVYSRKIVKTAKHKKKGNLDG